MPVIVPNTHRLVRLGTQVHHTISAQELLFLVIVVRLVCLIVHEVFGLTVFLLGCPSRAITILAFRASPTLECSAGSIFTYGIILTELGLSLLSQLGVKLVLDRSESCLDFEEHFLSRIVLRVQVRMVLLGFVEVRLLDFLELVRA